MKITKDDIKKLIRESINEIERQDPREDPEGVYGVDPTGELGKEARSSDLVEKLERVIADLNSIVTELSK